MHIAKAHGLGNDFLLVDRADAPPHPESWVPRICERHIGLGADGLILYSSEGAAAVRMTLVNADGGEAEISGNGLRCLAAYAVSRGDVPSTHTVITAAGPRSVEVFEVGGTRYRVVTDLGQPILDSVSIPMQLDTPQSPVRGYALSAAGRTVNVTATSMGNPHCATFFDAPVSDEVLTTLGPALERHSVFPRRTNVEFVTVVSREELRVRFWERGVGYTRASGTGAASAAVAAMLNGLVDRRVRVVCDGGVLEVSWPEGGSVRQVGEVEILFEGQWLG
jgi:diaminopimelate epimerase